MNEKEKDPLPYCHDDICNKGDINELLKDVNYGDDCDCQTFEMVEKYGQKIWIIDGIELPANTTTEHPRDDKSKQLKMCSKKLHMVKNGVLKVFAFLHQLAMDHQMVYTVCCGNMISLTRDDQFFLPWDDDIDIVFRKKDNIVFEEMMKQGEPKILYDKGLPTNWIITNSVYKNYKFRIQTIPGRMIYRINSGLHINVCDYEKMGKAFGKPYCKNDDLKETNVPEISVCGIKLRVLKKNIARQWIETYFGKGPILYKRHPDLQKSFDD